uniref:Uncharacterized protein n=1 Tax=Megaselia scalaris TaxID=36166 RepID=T1GID4_MEGSC
MSEHCKLSPNNYFILFSILPRRDYDVLDEVKFVLLPDIITRSSGLVWNPGRESRTKHIRSILLSYIARCTYVHICSVQYWRTVTVRDLYRPPLHGKLHRRNYRVYPIIQKI